MTGRWPAGRRISDQEPFTEKELALLAHLTLTDAEIAQDSDSDLAQTARDISMC
jgi:hypothetical protein